MSNVKYFTNDKFRTLAYLYDVKGKGDYIETASCQKK